MPAESQPRPTCRQDEVTREFKRSGPQSVRELAPSLGLSYMGAKQHCLALERKGLLASRNSHRGAGRPLLVYSLTRKGQAWFEDGDNAIAISVLRHTQNLFGTSSASKLLLLHFQDITKKYKALMPPESSVAEKMGLLAKFRDDEGHMAELVPGFRIIERHNPAASLHKAFPGVDALEESLFRNVLGVPVRRRIVQLGDQYEIHFELHTPLALKS